MLSPDDHARLAYSLEHTDQQDEAITHYKIAIARNPTKSHWYYNLALALYDQGDLI